MRKPRVYLACPHYGHVEPETFEALINCSDGSKWDVEYNLSAFSLLANHFNRHWCAALNGGFEYFAMLHADVAPVDPCWLDALRTILLTNRLEMVSCVIPLKNDSGQTSTAIGDIDWPHRCEMRILTLADCAKVPETFTSADFGHPDRPLLVNTGCWLADIRAAVWRGLTFSILDKVSPDDHGNLKPNVLSEDWNFSLQMHRAVIRYAATRAIKIRHIGRRAYCNYPL